MVVSTAVVMDGSVVVVVLNGKSGTAIMLPAVYEGSSK
jgi:hypothetical protein